MRQRRTWSLVGDANERRQARKSKCESANEQSRSRDGDYSGGCLVGAELVAAVVVVAARQKCFLWM